MKPPIEGKTIEKLEALSYQRTGTTRIVKGNWWNGKTFDKEKEVANWDYLPTEWQEDWDEQDVLRITFTDGSRVDLHPRGYEADGISVHYVKGASKA